MEEKSFDLKGERVGSSQQKHLGNGPWRLKVQKQMGFQPVVSVACCRQEVEESGKYRVIRKDSLVIKARGQYVTPVVCRIQLVEGGCSEKWEY